MAKRTFAVKRKAKISCILDLSFLFFFPLDLYHYFVNLYYITSLAPSSVFLFMQCIRAVGRVYNRNYERRPMLTLCVTNACLGAISDGLAQTIGFYDYHRNHPKGHPYSAALEGTLPEHVREHESLWAPPPRFDPWRTVRFALYNFSVAPIVGKWYILLDRFFPMPKTLVTTAAKRLADKITIKRMVIFFFFASP